MTAVGDAVALKKRALRRLLWGCALVLLIVVVGLSTVITIHCLRFKRSVEQHVGHDLRYHATQVTESGRIIVAYRRADPVLPGLDLLYYGRAWPNGDHYLGVTGSGPVLWLLDDGEEGKSPTGPPTAEPEPPITGRTLP